MIWDMLAAFIRGAQKLQTSYRPGMEFHDRREFAAQKHDGWPTRARAWKRVTGITLHQTACHMGERPARYDGVGAHVGVTREGRVIWLHSFDRRVIHGNGWNDGCVGIELDGLYAGIDGDDSTVWDDPSTARREVGMGLTDVQAEAARQVVRWIVRECATNGATIKALVAHRQSSRDRRNDPGSAIWKAVALPLHVELGLSDGGQGFDIGGRPIPEAWNHAYKGERY